MLLKVLPRQGSEARLAVTPWLGGSVKEGVLSHFSFHSWKRSPRSYLGGGSSKLKKGDKAHFFIRVAGDASEGPNTVAIVVRFWDSRASAGEVIVWTEG
jgi:hypothetical protein